MNSLVPGDLTTFFEKLYRLMKQKIIKLSKTLLPVPAQSWPDSFLL